MHNYPSDIILPHANYSGEKFCKCDKTDSKIIHLSESSFMNICIKFFIKIFQFKTCEDIRNFYDDFAHNEISANNKLDGKLFCKDSVDVTVNKKNFYRAYSVIKYAYKVNDNN